MSARSRAAPWFGTKGERSACPPTPPGVDETTMQEALFLGSITRLPGGVIAPEALAYLASPAWTGPEVYGSA